MGAMSNAMARTSPSSQLLARTPLTTQAQPPVVAPVNGPLLLPSAYAGVAPQVDSRGAAVMLASPTFHRLRSDTKRRLGRISAARRAKLRPAVVRGWL